MLKTKDVDFSVQKTDDISKAVLICFGDASLVN